MSGNVYISNQEVINAVGIMGSVGESKKRHVYNGTQKVMDYRFAVMGDISEIAAVKLKEPRAHS